MVIKIIPAIANNNELTQDFDYITQPSKTYKLNIENNTISGGYVYEKEAIKQTIYCILNTERYDYLIYSWNYGVEIKNLIGEHLTYVIPELERVIEEALLQDDRIEEVNNFNFEIVSKNELLVTFEVVTIEGIIDVEKVVSV